MRTVLTIAAFVAVACDAPGRPGPPVRLAVASGTDTVVINGQRATSLPVLAIDAHGRTASVAAIRYELAGGLHVPLSPDGEVTCSQAGDLVVRASLASLDTRLSVLCRPVEHVRIPGPIQFVLGDSALGRPRDLPVEAYGRDGRAVALIAASVGIMNPAIASLSRLTMTPHQPGATLAWAYVGEREARIGVHVYQRVDGLNALDTITRIVPKRRLIAVPLRLAAGEVLRQHLPPGSWMLSMLPEDDRDPTRVRLRVEGATCNPVLTTRRLICGSRLGAMVVVYRPPGSADPPRAPGDLLIRWMDGE